ncbi:hypothetical protein ACFV0T_24940 [Streptomyces sp. NPDC059582]|uniref:hypothetical protein n=1 Tax=Streptomyces sp. NPDC059582 TaxID=3346875 RepID=UPI0036845980
MLGNLLISSVQVYCGIYVITQFHSAWRWLAAPMVLLALVFTGRGVAVAVQDLLRRGAAPSPSPSPSPE